MFPRFLTLVAIALLLATGCRRAATTPTEQEIAKSDDKKHKDPKSDDKLVAAPFAGSVSGDEPELDYVVGKMVGKDGKAEFTFGKWRLLFEGVPSDSPGSRVVFQYPSKSGYGEAIGTSFNGVKFSQKWDTKANEISVESFRFKLLGKAEKLAFKDHTYTATEKTQTIIIDKDGKTRLADKK